MRLSLPLFAACAAMGLSACGGSYHGNLSGNFDGVEFDPSVGYFGGPFIVFSNDELDCLDVYWVSKNYDEENPWDRDFSLLQITFEDSDVVEGTFEVSGVAPVGAAYLTGEGDALTVAEASSGQVIIDKISGRDKLSGSLNLSTVSGSASGDFTVESCANLSSAY